MMMFIVILLLFLVNITMINSKKEGCHDYWHVYRLGDMVKHRASGRYHINNKIKKCNAGTIGAEYMDRTNKSDDMTILKSITQARCSAFNINNDINNFDVIIHVRVGDVMCDWKGTLRPPKISLLKDYIYEHVPSFNQRNISIIWGQPSNYLCLNETKKYITSLKDTISTYTNINILDYKYGSINADIDFCRMLNSKLFLRGHGGFSDLVTQLRKEYQRENIEIPKLAGYLYGGYWMLSDPYKEQPDGQCYHCKTCCYTQAEMAKYKDTIDSKAKRVFGEHLKYDLNNGKRVL